MTDIIARQGIGIAPAAALPADTRRWALASIGMLLALLAPVLWNGFPLIFPDTGGYLTRPIEGTLAMGRSVLYGWFLFVSMPLAFWPVVVAQSAATVWVIVLTLRCHGLGGRPWLALGLTVALALVTSLAWCAGQLIPDILFPLGVLALHLLAFRADMLTRTERLGLAVLIALAIACHMAALGLCLGLLAGLWLLPRIKVLALPSPHLAWAGISVVAGVALSLLSNLAMTGSVAFTPGGSSFLFGRLIEDGIAERYLNEHCPNPTLRICAYRQTLPENADDWLWANDTPFYVLGGADGFGPEATRIILDTIKLYPWMHLQAAVADTVTQFTSLQTEVSIDDNDPAYDAIRDFAPQLMPALTRARQQAQPFDVAPLNMVHVPVAALSIGAVLVALMLRRQLALSSEIIALCLTVLLALAVNAAVCGVFSHPVDRYQSRLAPLAPLALAMIIFSRRKQPKVKSS